MGTSRAEAPPWVGPGAPPGEHLCPQGLRRAPSPSCWLSLHTPSPHFPVAWKEGEPCLKRQSLLPQCPGSPWSRSPGRLGVQGALSSQEGIRGPTYRERKGEFLWGQKVGITSRCRCRGGDIFSPSRGPLMLPLSF